MTVAVDGGNSEDGASAHPGSEPLVVFHVGNFTVDGTTVTAEQQLCGRFADHRGRIDLPALGVLFDHIGGYPFALAGGAGVSGDGPSGSSLQARLTMSSLGHIDVDARLSATAELAMHDDRSGVTRVEIRTGTGRVCCVGTARSMRVGRSADIDPHRLDALGVPDCADAHDIRPPAVIPSSLSGRDIVAEIAAQVRPAGAIVDLLGGRVEVPVGDALDASDGPALRFVVDTAPWMGNAFGTMHGGVIMTIIGQACSLAGQQMAAAGADYAVGDLSAGFYRSPAVHGATVVVDVSAVKVGRRIASLRATMADREGTLLAEGVADIHYG
ncbi:hypothetical protein GCM10009624_02270 [Gordonia sinesedis]